MTTNVTDETFSAEVLETELPVLVDFWATWCGPCKMISPLVDEIAVEKAGKLKVVKMDIDDSRSTAGAYGVRGVPTLILFHKGVPVATNVGALTKGKLEEFTSKVINNESSV
jgi:thioredoxin 1